jgi:CRP/FNR family cyclic AMP-dependent transcriptional regulator
MNNDSEIQFVLAGMKLFKGCSKEDIKLIVSFGRTIRFRKDEVIIREGEPAPGLNVLMAGEIEVKLPKISPEHHRLSDIHLYNMQHGDYVGEFSLIDGKPASADALALNDCFVFHISRKSFNKLVDDHEGIGKNIYRNMLEVMVARAREYDEELDM